MKMNLYVTYDRVASEGGNVFEAPNDQAAYRSFSRMLAQHNVRAKEFSLYCVGTYDNVQVRVESTEHRLVDVAALSQLEIFQDLPPAKEAAN